MQGSSWRLVDHFPSSYFFTETMAAMRLNSKQGVGGGTFFSSAGDFRSSPSSAYSTSSQVKSKPSVSLSFAMLKATTASETKKLI